MWKAWLHETSFPDLSVSILFVQSLWPYTNEDNNNSLLTQNCQNYKDFRDITPTTVTLKPPFTDVSIMGFIKQAVTSCQSAQPLAQTRINLIFVWSFW